MNIFEMTASIAVNANPYIAAINTATKVTTQLVGGIEELSVESVLLASKFERSANSIAVFSGSLSSAKRELYEIDKISRNTVGLRMEAAEEGYQRLRALGFEAKRANSLIKELGEEKELSGADDVALKRTFFNFTQIASGGQKISQEIRELLTAMPSLKRAFLDAFGTLDPKKIQSIVESNPDAFFDRLTNAMEKNKAAVGGLDDSFGKLEDAWTENKRAFGEAFLPEVTDDVRELTRYLQGSKKSWREWGDYAVDVIVGVKNTIKEASEFKAVQQTGDLASFFFQSSPVGAALTLLSQSGQKTRDEKESKKPQESFKGAKKWLDDVSGEVQADNIIQEEKRIRDEEIARQKEITNLTTWKNAKDSIFDSFYSGQEAKLTSYLTNGFNDEKHQINDLANLRADRYKNELTRTTNYYNRLITLANGDKTEIQKIEADKAQDVAKINADFVKDSYSTQRKLAEIERDSYNDRLKESINFKRMLTDEWQFQLDTDSFNFGEQLKNSFSPSSESFDQMIKLTKESYAEVSRLTRESYDEQLKEIGISEERKTNLKREAVFAEKKLAEQSRRDVLRIEEDKRNRINQFYADIYGAVASAEQQKIQRKSTFLESAFGFNNLSLSELDRTADLIKSKTDDLTKAQNDYRSADNKRLDAETAYLKYQNEIEKQRELFVKKGQGTSIQPEQVTKLSYLKNAASSAAEESARLETVLENLKGGISDYYEDFGAFRQQLTENLGDETVFDQISAKIFSMEKFSALSVLDAKIEQAKRILEKPGGDPVANKSALDSLINERGNLAADYFRKEQDQRAKSIVGMREYIGLLQNSDPVLSAVIENKRLTESLEDQADAYEKLIGNTKLNKEELNARILQTLAGQPTLTDIIGDTEVSAINDTFDAIDSGFEGITEALGLADNAAAHFIENLLGGLTKLAANEIFKMLFNIDGDATQVLTGESSGGGSFWKKLLGWGIKALGGAAGGAATSGGGSFGGVTFGHEAIHGFADGGLITGGVKGKDSVAAWLMPDEYVARKEAVAYYGAGFYEALNQKLIPKDFFTANKFAEGGLASGLDTLPLALPPANSYSSVSNSNQSNDNRTYNLYISGGSKGANGRFSKPSEDQLKTTMARAIIEAERRR